VNTFKPGTAAAFLAFSEDLDMTFSEYLFLKVVLSFVKTLNMRNAVEKWKLAGNSNGFEVRRIFERKRCGWETTTLRQLMKHSVQDVRDGLSIL